LIEEGLEEMEVAPVDERHVDPRSTQPLGGVESAEAAPEDHDAVSLRRPWLCGSRVSRTLRFVARPQHETSAALSGQEAPKSPNPS